MSITTGEKIEETMAKINKIVEVGNFEQKRKKGGDS